VLQELAVDKALVTTEGARTFTHSPRTTLYASLEMRGSDGTPTRLAHVFGGFGGFEDHADSLSDPATEAAMDTLYDELRQKAEGVFCEAGMQDVVLDADLAGILAHEAIGHTCEADLVLGGSVAGPALGQVVASKKITLMDQAGLGLDQAATVAVHVDDEGTPCRDVTIIDRGVLREFLHNKETALELGMTPTGNARAHTYADEPLVRMRNTCILAGQDRLEDMIGAIDHGYYFTRSGNGQADFTGEFMFAVTCGYEIRRGKLGRAIRDTTISGIAFDMLKAVTHVGDRFVWSPGGWCGKKQIIPVTMGGPAIKTRINVGGR
jgi:TldD protein